MAKATNVIEILVKIRDEARQALTKIKKASSEVAGELDRDSDKLLKGATKDAKKATESLKKTTKEAKTTKKTLGGLGSTKFTGLNASIRGASKNFKVLRNEATKTKKNVSGLGSSLRTVFVGLGLAAVVRETIQFSKAITEVSTLVDSAINPTEELQATVLGLAQVYGAGTTETAKGLYQAISAGAVAGAEATGLLEIALKTAKAGVTDTAIAVDGITTIVNAFKLEMGQAEEVSDVLFATMKNGKTTIGELSNFMFQAAPLASALGVTYQELNAATIAMTLQGTKTAQAMTGLRAALQGLIRPGGDAEKAFQAVGFESAKAAIASVGLKGAFDIVAKAAGGNEGALIKMVGSIEGVQAIMQTTGDSSKFMQKGLDAVNTSAGSMQAAFDKVEESIGQDFDKAIASASVSMIQFGDAIKPVLTTLLRFVSEGAQGIASFVKENKTMVTVVVAAVTSMVAAWLTYKGLKLVADITRLSTVLKLVAIQVGTYTIATNAAGKSTSVFVGWSKVLRTALSVMLGPVGLIVTALGAMIAVLSSVGSSVQSMVANLEGIELAEASVTKVLDSLTIATDKLATAQENYDKITNASNATLAQAETAAKRLGEAKENVANIDLLVTKSQEGLIKQQVSYNQSLANGLPIIGKYIQERAKAKFDKGQEDARLKSLESEKLKLEAVTYEYAKYGSVIVKSAKDIASLSEAEAVRYKDNIEGANTYLKAEADLNKVRIKLGEEVSKLSEKEITRNNDVSASVDHLKERVKALSVEREEASKKQDKFSKATEKAILADVDAVEALKTAFTTFNVTKLDDVSEVLRGIARFSGEVGDGLRDNLAGKTVESIQVLLESLDTLSEKSGANTQAIAVARGVAIEAIFDKLGVTLASDLQEVDRVFSDTFKLLVSTGEASSKELLDAITANVDKIGTQKGIDDLKTQINIAMKQAGADTDVLGLALESLNDKQKELASQSDVTGQALTKAATALGASTIKDATAEFTALKDAFAEIESGFKDNAVSTSEYNKSVVSYLQGLHDYLVNVTGVSEAVASSSVKAEAAQRGLQLSVSETGRVSLITERTIRAANQKTKESIASNAKNIESLHKESMDAISAITSGGWDGVAETIRATYESTVIAESEAREAMLESKQVFIEASATGDAEIIAAAKQSYEDDVNSYKEALQAKIAASAEAAEAQAENNKKANASSERDDNLRQERESARSVDHYRDLKSLDRDYVKFQHGVAKLRYLTTTGYVIIMNRLMRVIIQTRDAYKRAEERADKYTKALQSAEAPALSMIAAAESLTSIMGVLGNEKLQALRDAIDSAKQKLRDLYDASISTLQGLRSELAQLRGDLEKVENLQYAQRVAELEAKLSAARTTGDAATIAALEESLNILNTIHKETIANIRIEKEERIRADEETAAKAKALDDENARNRSKKNGNPPNTGTPKFATGGPVSGAGTGTSDSILAYLSNGEFVMDAKTVKHYGESLFKKMQLSARGLGDLPKFATGGLVSIANRLPIPNRIIPRFATGGPVHATPAVTNNRQVEITLNVGNGTATGLFNESDADRLIDELQKAGAVS